MSTPSIGSISGLCYILCPISARLARPGYGLRMATISLLTSNNSKMDSASHADQQLAEFLGPELLEYVHAAIDDVANLPSAPPPSCVFPVPVPSGSCSGDSIPAPPPNSRFGKALSDEELQEALLHRVPKNTQKATNWGMNVWKSWCKDRNVAVAEPVAIPSETLNELMAKFVQEARKKDGGDYIPSSLLQIVTAIRRYLNDNGRSDVRFFDDKDPTFRLLRQSLDAKMKELTAKGLGCSKKAAQPILPEMEDELWRKEIFTRKTVKGFINVVYWYSCKMFGLRAADEHRSLVAQQFAIETDHLGKYLHFKGRLWKNWQGGLKHRRVDAKDLTIYAKPELGERCAVDCFEEYLSLIPQVGPFYRRPIESSTPKFSLQVIGVHQLETIVKRFCTDAGFEGYFTNHSGKVTCATQLFENNVDEQLIKRQTGHRSDAVRQYKRPSDAHALQVSDILQAPAPKRQQPPAQSHPDRHNSIMLPAGAQESLTNTFNFHSSGSQNIYIINQSQKNN